LPSLARVPHQRRQPLQSRAQPTQPAGVALVDKPAGWSSHRAVVEVRRALGIRKVGHAGTLDPFATGLLILLVGRATKHQQAFMALPKRYLAVARLGARSTTGDPEGEITVTGRIPPADRPLPRGTILQRPPRYSAVKVEGKRAYALARAGKAFELEPRPVTVYRFEELWREEKELPRACYLIECSSGTYVRALIEELGDAYCEQLRRLAVGPFSVEEALPPQGVDPSRLIGLEEALGRIALGRSSDPSNQG
jgi:tRNA pseudouridine55 synthase